MRLRIVKNMHEINLCHRKAHGNVVTMLLLESYNDDVVILHIYNAHYLT